MFDIKNVDRDVALFIFDIYVASLKIKKGVYEFDNVQNLLHDLHLKHQFLEQINRWLQEPAHNLF